MNSLHSDSDTSIGGVVKQKPDEEELDSSSTENSSSVRTERYGSFRSEHSYTYADSETEFLHRPRRADNYYGIRQEYLRSYTFTREQAPTNSSKPEKFKERVKRLKAVGWAILCCKYKPAQVQALREKLSSRSARFFHNKSDYLSPSRRFTVPSCIRPTLEVA